MILRMKASRHIYLEAFLLKQQFLIFYVYAVGRDMTRYARTVE
jgi:hypothetical protein